MSGPCQRPECGGEVHTDGWGTPIRCPARRCPRCDCADGTEQCEHCKVCPHADGGPNEPTHLTYEQLLPVAAAVHRREAFAVAGVRVLLPPFPDCPTCGQSPTELLVRNDSRLFLEDRVAFGFRPCGHTFTADGEDLFRAYDHAHREAP